VDAATVEAEVAAEATAEQREQLSTGLRDAGLGELMNVVVSSLVAPLHMLIRPHAPAPAVAHAAQLVSEEAAAVAAAVSLPSPPARQRFVPSMLLVALGVRESAD
jgi:hypothetical protein